MRASATVVGVPARRRTTSTGVVAAERAGAPSGPSWRSCRRPDRRRGVPAARRGGRRVALGSRAGLGGSAGGGPAAPAARLPSIGLSRQPAAPPRGPGGQARRPRRRPSALDRAPARAVAPAGEVEGPADRPEVDDADAPATRPQPVHDRGRRTGSRRSPGGADRARPRRRAPRRRGPAGRAERRSVIGRAGYRRGWSLALSRMRPCVRGGSYFGPGLVIGLHPAGGHGSATSPSRAGRRSTRST